MRGGWLTGRDRTVVIITVGAFLIFATMGIRQSFGLFLPGYTADLGIGRDTFSFAIAVQNLLWGLASPMFGALADRRGPVMAVALGGLFYTAGLLAMAVAGGSGVLLFGQVLIGMGLAGAGFSVVLGTVGKVVAPERRAMALALVSAAGSLGLFTVTPLAQIGIDTFSARGGVYVLAVLAFLMLLVAPLFKLPADAPKAAAQDNNWSVLKTALSSRSYVLLLTGFFVCGFQLVFISTHLPAYLDDTGFSASVAVTALALIGLSNIIGTLTCGWLGDRMPKKDALTWFYSLRSLVIILFLLAPLTPLSVAIFAAAIGFLWLGTVPLTSSLIAVMFGPRHMAMLYGLVFFSHQLGSFFGAWLGGILFEATGSYDIGWYLCILLGFAASALHFPIKERPDENYFHRYAA